MQARPAPTATTGRISRVDVASCTSGHTKRSDRYRLCRALPSRLRVSGPAAAATTDHDTDHSSHGRIQRYPDSDDVPIQCTLLYTAYHFKSWRSRDAWEPREACALRGRRGGASAGSVEAMVAASGGEEQREATSRARCCWMRVYRRTATARAAYQTHATPSIIGTHSSRLATSTPHC